MDGLKLWICVVSISGLFSAGCGEPLKPSASKSKTDSSLTNSGPTFPGATPTPGGANINLWTTTPPAIICGKPGYDFLLKEYLRPHCGSCHGEGSTIHPYFTATDLNFAYDEAITITKSQFALTVTHNNFCFPSCNLSTSGQVYQGIMQWTDNKTCSP